MLTLIIDDKQIEQNLISTANCQRKPVHQLCMEAIAQMIGLPLHMLKQVGSANMPLAKAS